MTPEESAYQELCAYTLTHGDPAFIHQHVVDARAVQVATTGSKRIGVAFALYGLCLHIEYGYTGREVQLAHMALARARREWPAYNLPDFRGSVSASDVMSAPEGAERDAAIHAWCQSIWQAVIVHREAVVRELVAQHILPSPNR